MRRRRAGLLAAFVLALSACTSGPADGDAAVSVLCSNDAAVCRAWAESFTERTGHRVTMERLPTSEALARIRRGDELAEYDVWHGGGAEMYAAAAADDLLTPYRSPAADGIPDAVRDPDGRWTGVYSSFLAFCVHPGALAEAGAPRPETWQDLLDPRLEGWISASSPRTSGTAFTTMVLQVDRLGEQPGLDYLSSLYDQVQQFTRSGTAPARVVARGEAAVALTFAPYCTAAAHDGAPVELVHPRDGTGYEIGAVAILADAPHPELAREYVDHAVSAEGQRAGDDSGIHQIPTQSALPGDLSEVLAEEPAPVHSSPLTERAARRGALLAWFTQEGGR